MRLFSARLRTSPPQETRILTDVNEYFVDLNLIYATYLARIEKHSYAYELANLTLPPAITSFLQGGQHSLSVLTKLARFLEKKDLEALRGLSKERLVYHPGEVKILPPIFYPEKTLVIGFSDQVDSVEKKLSAKVPTAFNKLASTFISTGERIAYPKFSRELDCDACLGVVIGKAGRRISPEQAWHHIAGFTLLVDVTARDVNGQESLTRNNLLGKNPSSSCPIGPALSLKESKQTMQEMLIELTVDESRQQKFRVRDLCFTVEDVISHWSIVGLSVGDVLALPASLALKCNPPQPPAFLRPGSTVKCFSPEIGELVNSVFLEEEITRDQ